jgi:hypothetical protein
MSMKKIALWLAIAAVCVNTPRYVIMFLLVDGIELPAGLEGLLLMVSSVGTGVILTGGGAFVAHALAYDTVTGQVRVFLTVSWILLNFFGVILLAPWIVLAVSTSRLALVLNTPSLQWWWSIVSVVSVEWLAAASMSAFKFLKAQDSFDETLDLLADFKELTGGQTNPYPTPQAALHTNHTESKRRERDR